MALGNFSYHYVRIFSADLFVLNLYSQSLIPILKRFTRVSVAEIVKIQTFWPKAFVPFTQSW